MFSAEQGLSSTSHSAVVSAITGEMPEKAIVVNAASAANPNILSSFTCSPFGSFRQVLWSAREARAWSGYMKSPAEAQII